MPPLTRSAKRNLRRARIRATSRAALDDPLPRSPEPAVVRDQLRVMSHYSECIGDILSADATSPHNGRFRALFGGRVLESFDTEADLVAFAQRSPVSVTLVIPTDANSPPVTRIRPRIENWIIATKTVRVQLSSYSAPEIADGVEIEIAVGEVYDHPNYDQGTHIETSRIMERTDKEIITMSGSVYQLGERAPTRKLNIYGSMIC